MYIHGFIDGILATVVLGMAALIVAAMIYSRKRNSSERGGLLENVQPVSYIVLSFNNGKTADPFCGTMKRDERGKSG